jgi:hypothetical protein
LSKNGSQSRFSKKAVLPDYVDVPKKAVTHDFSTTDSSLRDVSRAITLGKAGPSIFDILKNEQKSKSDLKNTKPPMTPPNAQ